MSLGSERRFDGHPDLVDMPLSIGVSLHVRSDTAIVSRIDAEQGMAVVRLVGPVLAGATFFFSHGGLIHVRDALTETLQDLERPPGRRRR